MERVIEAAEQKAQQAEAKQAAAEAEKQQVLQKSIRALAQTGMLAAAIAALLGVSEVTVREALL